MDRTRQLRPASCLLTRRSHYYSDFLRLSQSVHRAGFRPVCRFLEQSVARRPKRRGGMLSRLGAHLAIGLLKFLALLPYGFIARLGDGLGWLLYQIPSNRKRIVHINLSLCFPAWSAEHREQ